ncbi:MAG: sugar transferase [Pseudomonadota bacterium]
MTDVRIGSEAVDGPGALFSGPRSQSTANALRVAVLSTADGLVAALAVLLLRAAGNGLSPSGAVGTLVPEAFVGATLFVGLHAICGLYGVWRANPLKQFQFRVISALILAALGAIYHFADIPWVLLIAGTAALFGSLVFFGLAMATFARKFLMSMGLWYRPAVLVGPSAQTAAMGLALENTEDHAFQIVSHATVKTCLAQPHHDEHCALLISTGDYREDLRIAGELPFRSVIILNDVGMLQTVDLWAQPVGDAFGIEVRHNLLAPNTLFIKRAIDVMLTAPALLVALPIILVAGAAICVIDPGNPLFRQKRVGHQGRTFNVLKLRTMCTDAEERLNDYLNSNADAAAEWKRCKKLKNDPRIIPFIGNFLRQSSIDELPQLWNVLRGEMSLIGPRPFPQYHLDEFDPRFVALRQAVMPGLSGLWQITSRSDGDLATQERADTFYIRNWSIWLDLYVLAYTVPAVVTRRGAR